MHELVKISNKVCTMNNTQLYKGKKRVFTSHEQVFWLHELDLKNNGIPNARPGQNFKQICTMNSTQLYTK